MKLTSIVICTKQQMRLHYSILPVVPFCYLAKRKKNSEKIIKQYKWHLKWCKQVLVKW